MFEKAVRIKLRFDYKGSLSVEDLWDLSVEELDSIFKALSKAKKTDEEESLLQVRSQADEVLELKIGIIKHIVAVKLEEKQAKTDAKKKAEEKKKLLGVLAKKQDEALESLTAEELQARIESL